jgi:hypothetical protein
MRVLDRYSDKTPVTETFVALRKYVEFRHSSLEETMNGRFDRLEHKLNKVIVARPPEAAALTSGRGQPTSPSARAHLAQDLVPASYRRVTCRIG